MLTGQKFESGDEKDICSALYCSACESGERRNPNHAGSCDGLDCTEVRFRKNIIAFTVLFYLRFRYGSLWPGQVVCTRETGK